MDLFQEFFNTRLQLQIKFFEKTTIMRGLKFKLNLVLKFFPQWFYLLVK